MSTAAPDPAPSIGRLFVTISLPLAAGAALNQLNRAVTAVIAPVLADAFALSASDLGLMGAVLFAAYALAQLPVGAALDRYGPRRVQAALMLVIAAGAAVFATSPGLAQLLAGRVLLGIGISAALMAQLKATRQWFPPGRIATVAGWTVALSSLGGILATVPAEWAASTLGWRGVFLAVAVLALLAAAWIWAQVPDVPKASRSTGGLAAELATVGRILRHPVFIRMVPTVILLSVLNFTWQGLWLGPWLRDVAGLDGPGRAQVLLVYALGFTAGSFLSGIVQARLVAAGAHPLAMIVACTFGTIALSLGFAFDVGLPLWLGWSLWPFLASVGPVGYTLVSARFPGSETGRVSTAINAVMLAVVFAEQQGIGIILDLWPRTAVGGWDKRGYAAALIISAAFQVIGLAWLALRREARAAPALRDGAP
ncbi:MFS transporter [Elioraea sp.]|uniref:MFS transporter n=1 Tax=Elioraea sp. TaxID=2185103 RepID=UPI0025C6E649|nr:MFS transporter [Elioraea sp.]